MMIEAVDMCKNNEIFQDNDMNRYPRKDIKRCV